MPNHIDTVLRSTLAECTVSWSEAKTSPLDAYVDFQCRLGSLATRYEDYISTAITSGGYRRDSTLKYREVVAKNTDYALMIADEFHRRGLTDAELTLDAVALGKVAGWKQSDFLTFFLAAMARPVVPGPSSPEYRHLLDIYNHPQTYNKATFDDESLGNDVRLPHYQAFAAEYWQRTKVLGVAPINRSIRVADWNQSLGSQAEEHFARLIGIRVATPQIITSSCDFSLLDLPHDLSMSIKELRELGAHIIAPPEASKLVLT